MSDLDRAAWTKPRGAHRRPAARVRDLARRVRRPKRCGARNPPRRHRLRPGGLPPGRPDRGSGSPFAAVPASVRRGSSPSARPHRLPALRTRRGPWSGRRSSSRRRPPPAALRARTARPRDRSLRTVARRRAPIRGALPSAARGTAPRSTGPVSPSAATGVRAIDGLTTFGVGQRIGLFSGSGRRQEHPARQNRAFAAAEVIVVGLVGERAARSTTYLEACLGPAGRARAVVVVATSDEPALRRIAPRGRRRRWPSTSATRAARSSCSSIR